MPKTTELNLKNLTEILHELKRGQEDALIVTGPALAERLWKLESSLIKILEEMTGDRDAPPMLEKEKLRRIQLFHNALAEAEEIEKENWKFEIAFMRWQKIDSNSGDEIESEDGYGIVNNAKSVLEEPPQPKKGEGKIRIKFSEEPSSSLKEKLEEKGFTLDGDVAFGRNGVWLEELVEEIILAKGEIVQQARKGKFDPWR